MAANGYRNYDIYLNELGRNRRPAMLRTLDNQYASAPPDCLKMAGGYCHPSIFPFKRVSVELKDGVAFTFTGDELEEAIQYQPTAGFPPLKKQLKEMVRHFHKPPYDAETIIVSGHQDGICKVFEMTLETGRPLFIAEPTYASAIDMMRPYEPAYHSVEEDADGMIPKSLKRELENALKSSGANVKKAGNLLYVVPNGSNPSGTMISTERKREIYKLACEYDLLILEDDPYFFYNYQDEKPVSFLSLDTDQRVIRIEGLSKIMTPGFRIAMATGPLPLIQKMEWHMQITVGHVASLPQAIVHRILNEWGHEGFMKQVEHVRGIFRTRRQSALDAAEKHLTGLVKFNAPKAGMFLWMEILGIEDVSSLVLEKAVKRGIMVVPGMSFFAPREGSGTPRNCIRVSYSMIEADKFDQAFELLADIIKTEHKLLQSNNVKIPNGITA